MNRKQKVAIIAGALVIALLALFPPWLDGYPAGLYWRFADEHVARQIDHAALYELQVATLALTVAAVLVLKERKGG